MTVPVALLDPAADDEVIAEFVRALKGMPESRGVPPWYERLTIVRHLAGQHDQSTHGHGGGGGAGAGTKEDPVRTGSVVVAQKALAEGKYVELRSERQVGTLLTELQKAVKDAEAAGGKPPNIDLCKVSVKNTNLFCSQSKGIPRAQMPQLKGRPIPGSPADKLPKNAKGEADVSAGFVAHLRAQGISTTPGSVDAKYLKASQSEIDGTKVVGMAGAMRAGKIPNEAIFVTRDDYVVDGHHRWAATVGNEYIGGKALKMDVNVIDSDIINVLGIANDYAASMGLPQQAVRSVTWTALDLVSDQLGPIEDELRHLAGQHDQSTHGHGGGGFDDVESAGAYGEEHWKSWRKGLSEDERYGISTYLEDVDSINGPLRHGGEQAGFAADATKGLDSALARSKMPDELTLYRGVAPDALPGDPSSLVGKTFTDKGFPSTSLNRDVAENYAAGGPVVAIHAAKGSPGGFIDRTAKEQAETLAPKEAEVLLPRNATFRVTGWEPDTRTLLVEYG